MSPEDRMAFEMTLARNASIAYMHEEDKRQANVSLEYVLEIQKQMQ